MERCQKLGAWLKMARQRCWSCDEGEHASCRRHFGAKAQCLQRYAIDWEGYDDKLLADDLEHGFDLVGDAPKSSVLLTRLVPATISRQHLDKHAAEASKALRFMTRSSGDLELDNSGEDCEVAKGWMIGSLEGRSLSIKAFASWAVRKGAAYWWPVSESGLMLSVVLLCVWCDAWWTMESPCFWWQSSGSGVSLIHSNTPSCLCLILSKAKQLWFSR